MTLRIRLLKANCEMVYGTSTYKFESLEYQSKQYPKFATRLLKSQEMHQQDPLEDPDIFSCIPEALEDVTD